MKIVRVLFSLLLILQMGCSEGGSTAEPKPCVYASQALAMPHPGWGMGADFAPPERDMGAKLLKNIRPGWHADLTRADGWPKLPTIIIPLSAAGTGVDESKIKLFGQTQDGSGFQEAQMVFEPSLHDDGLTLVLDLQTPIPPWTEQVILVLEQGAVENAQALAVCALDGTPMPEYAQAEQNLPDGVAAELALPFSLSTVHKDLPALWTRLKDNPVLTVGDIQLRTLDSFNDASPAPQVAALLQDNLAHVILDLPDYRAADGTISLSGDGGFQAQGITRPGLLVVLPASGTAPYPWVLFQHGGGQDKSEVFRAAGPLAQAGFAFVACDLPFHGDRASSSGGNDLDILDFDHLLRTRDNFRQAAADHMAVLSGLDTLNQALEPVLGVSQALDKERSFYMGLSMGAISGSLTFSSTPDLAAAALFVGGCHYPSLVTFGVFSLFIDDLIQLNALDQSVVLGLAEVLLDGGDPAAYAQRSEDRQSPPRAALFFQAVEEAIIDWPVSDAWARAFGADLAAPFDHQVPGMTQIDLPAQDNFSWSTGGQTATRLLIHNPMVEVDLTARHGELIRQDYAQEMVASCFTSLLSGGSCQVSDSGYMNH